MLDADFMRKLCLPPLTKLIERKHVRFIKRMKLSLDLCLLQLISCFHRSGKTLVDFLFNCCTFDAPKRVDFSTSRYGVRGTLDNNQLSYFKLFPEKNGQIEWEMAVNVWCETHRWTSLWHETKGILGVSETNKTVTANEVSKNEKFLVTVDEK